jgi:uncharacterized ferritin-like protein (DUF455 family)
MAEAKELRQLALAVLRIADPQARCDAVRALADFEGSVAPGVDLIEPHGVPGRPAKPVLVPPGSLASRPVGTRQGRAALLHALAHIEFNAIGLALDHIWRFARLPDAYYRQWVQVAVEEARHFQLLVGRLREVGYDYGDFPAHDGLWEMARRTSGDVLARMAVVPRTLEARGLDASPAVRAKFASVGDPASAAVIDVILRDEIGHVAVGNRWFRHLCAARGQDPRAVHRWALRQFEVPTPKGPFNLRARLEAGFTSQELDELQAQSR